METLKFVMATTFYPPYHLGGDAVHVYHLSNELAKLGHEVHVIHSIDSYRWQRKGEPAHEYPNHENVTVHSIKSPVGKISPLISYVSGSPYPVAKKIMGIIADVRPDFLHHHNIAGLGPFILNAKASRVLYTAHDYWLICQMDDLIKYNGNFCRGRSNCFVCSLLSHRPPQLWRHARILNKKIKNVDTIIAPSEYMKCQLQELEVKGDFTVIPNFVPQLSRIGSPLYKFPYFLFVGVLREHKGILNLIDAFLNLQNEINAKLLIVGSGYLESRIRYTISKNNCSDKIVMLGKVDDLILANIYANALAVVVPSIWPENCPLVALEALSVGTPVIGSCNGGLREIIERINNRLLLSKDVSDISEKILGFNPRLYPKNEIMNIFKNNFSFDQYYKRYIKTLANHEPY